MAHLAPLLVDAGWLEKVRKTIDKLERESDGSDFYQIVIPQWHDELTRTLDRLAYWASHPD